MDERKWFKSKAAIARAFNVNPKTVGEWTGKPWFPKRDERVKAWPVDKVAAAVEKHNEEQEARVDGYGNKEEKTRLECERLRWDIRVIQERFKQADIETQRMQDKLHSVADCNTEWDRAGASLRATVDSWQQHETAKHPKDRARIDSLCASFLARLEGVR